MSGGYAVYGGYRRQRGGKLFGSFRKMMAPIGRQALSGLKSVARNKTVRSIAKQAAQKGAEVLSGVAMDAMQGRNIGEAFRERGREVAMRTITGEPSTPAAATSHKRKRKIMNRPKKLKQRKKLAPAKKLSKRPAKKLSRQPAKKRRRKLSRAALNRELLF